MVLNKKNKNKITGFTVLELMVVMGIMVMMLILTIPNFQGFDRNQVLEVESDKLFSVFRQAQVWALTGQTVGSNRYNFGVHFMKCASAGGCSYIFFKDAFGGNNRYDSGEEYGIGINMLGKGVYVSGLKKGDVSTLNNLDIVFEAPSGDVYFDGVLASPDSAEITLTSPLSGKSKIISINGESGQIDIR
jgi:Tfp pilus assembly protein FimT